MSSSFMSSGGAALYSKSRSGSSGGTGGGGRSGSVSKSGLRDKKKKSSGSKMSRRDSLELANAKRSASSGSGTTLENEELRDLLQKYGYQSATTSISSSRRYGGGRGAEEEEEGGEEEEESKDDFHGRGHGSSTRSSAGPGSKVFRKGKKKSAVPQQEEQQQQQQQQARATKAKPKPKGILRAVTKSNTRRTSKKRIVFNKNATLHFMPSHELVAARRSRKGPWDPAPEHDELWDGDLQVFRAKPLTALQLQQLLQRKEREYLYEQQGGGGSGLNYTYPAASYDYAYGGEGADDGDLDELDSYLDEMSLGGSLDRNCTDVAGGAASKNNKACYICTPPQNWTARNVKTWMKDHVVGGDFFGGAFEQNYVDGRMFLQMEERDLRNIGIKRGADRQAILSGKQELLKGALERQACDCTF